MVDAPRRIMSSWVDDLDCSTDDSVASPAGVSPTFIPRCRDVSVLASAFSVGGCSINDTGRMIVVYEESFLHQRAPVSGGGSSPVSANGRTVEKNAELQISRPIEDSVAIGL